MPKPNRSADCKPAEKPPLERVNTSNDVSITLTDHGSALNKFIVNGVDLAPKIEPDFSVVFDKTKSAWLVTVTFVVMGPCVTPVPTC